MIVWMKIVIILFWNHFSLIDGTYWKTFSKLKLDVFKKKLTDVLMHWLKSGTYLLLLLFFFYYSLVVVEDLFALDSAANICNRLIFMPFSPKTKIKKFVLYSFVGSQTKWYQNETKKHIDTRKESTCFLFFNNEPNRIKVPAV